MCTLGSTPPWAMVTRDRSLFNSSSLRMANCKWYDTVQVPYGAKQNKFYYAIFNMENLKTL